MSDRILDGEKNQTERELGAARAALVNSAKALRTEKAARLRLGNIIAVLVGALAGMTVTWGLAMMEARDVPDLQRQISAMKTLVAETQGRAMRSAAGWDACETQLFEEVTRTDRDHLGVWMIRRTLDVTP